MIRRYGTGHLRQNRSSDKEDVNPMENLANLTDAMLLLAVGIMVALIMHWNLNVYTTQLSKKQELSDNVKQSVAESVQNGSGMQELGKVYKDPKTGKMYMVQENK